MANDTDLLAALKAAHDAGDDEAAAAIAAQMSAQPVTHEPVKQPDTLTITPSDPSEQPGGEHWMEKYGPTSGMSGLDKFRAGIGQSFVDTGRGISQLFGGQSKSDTDEQRRLDAPLDRTGAGLAGNILGGVAQSALPGLGAEAAGAKIASGLATSPGALQAAQAIYRIARPAATGAAYGALAPVGSNETRAGNAGLGAAAGEVGQVLGNAGANVLRSGEDALTAGARKGADIARKYGIPLSMPQLAGKFTGFVGDTLDKLPFSGASDRRDAQRSAFNDALGRTAGIPNAQGAINTDMVDHARDTVGSAIGNMASNRVALVTPKQVQGVTQLLQDVNDVSTPETARVVNNYANKMFGMGASGPSKVIPINNALPGGPIAQIPGDAWREQNTQIGNHIRRLGPNDGDLKYYLGELQDHYMDTMQNAMSPEEFNQFQSLRGQYRNNRTIAPLAEKAGDEGINPLLVQARAISAKNNRGDVGELGDFAKSMLAKKYPDSGTAQRALMYSAITGGLGAGAGALLDDENHGTGAAYGALPGAAMIAGGLAGRGLNSQALSRLYQARMPEPVAGTIRDLAARSPVAAQRAEQVIAPQEGYADGGEVKKSTFWDLVQQAVKELASPSTNAPPTPRPAPGTVASGSVGQDFDNKVNQAVQGAGG
jgi:hypothetical protein